MRRTNKIIQITESITTNKKAEYEEISAYDIDFKNKFIHVVIQLKTSDLINLSIENYYFKEDVFISYPTENELWSLIDRKRTE